MFCAVRVEFKPQLQTNAYRIDFSHLVKTSVSTALQLYSFFIPDLKIKNNPIKTDAQSQNTQCIILQNP